MDPLAASVLYDRVIGPPQIERARARARALMLLMYVNRSVQRFLAELNLTG